jgi:hypothetical protein
MKVILYPGGGDSIEYEDCTLVSVIDSGHGEPDAVVFTDNEGFLHTAHNMPFQVIEKP